MINRIITVTNMPWGEIHQKVHLLGEGRPASQIAGVGLDPGDWVYDQSLLIRRVPVTAA